MSNSDFEDRLNRIRASAEEKVVRPSIGEAKTGMRHGRFALGCAIFAGSLQLVKVVNAIHDSVRDQYGVPAALGLGLGVIAIMFLAAFLVYSAIRPARSTSAQASIAAYPTKAARPPVQTSARARLFFSLLGLGMGGLACLILFIANAAGQPEYADQVDVETARDMLKGSFILALLLATLALLIGFIGIFVRGLPMRRVPIFFLLGAMLLYTSFHALRIHPKDWSAFMEEFIRSFKD